MTHVDEGTLLAHLDGQSGDGREEVAEHLAACPRCAAELRSLSDMTAELRGALFLTDVPAPIEAARARVLGTRPAVSRPQVRHARQGFHLGPFRVGLLQAAALALVLAGVVGAAIPGTPLRLWVESVIAAVTGADDEPVAVTPADPAPAPSVPEVTTPAVDETRVQAVNGRVHVVLRDPPPNARIVIDLSDDDRATLSATASFEQSAGRLEAFSIGEGDIEITLPRAGITGTIEINGRIVVQREAGEYTYLAPGATRQGSVVVLRVPR
jgi:hypothetical protein